jgi:hypothetical protein
MTMTLKKLTKHKKVTPNEKQVGKTKGITRRKRAPTDSSEGTTPTLAPYKWTEEKRENRTTKRGEAIMSTRAAAKDKDTEISETDSDDDEDDEKEGEDDDDSVVTCSDNSSPTRTPAASRHMLQIQAMDQVKILKLNNEKLESCIKILSSKLDQKCIQDWCH